MKPVDPDALAAYAQATWARQQRQKRELAQAPPEPPSAPVAPRKPAGQGGHITPSERLEIQQAYLLTPGVTVTALARERGRTREAIAGCLKGEDFQQVKQAVHADLVAIAKDRLSGSVDLAAESWVASVGVAAARGDHKPAKELLLHTGVISPLAEGHGADHVQVIVMQPGQTLLEPPVIELGATLSESAERRD